MELIRPPDVRSFLAVAGPLLQRHEGRNNLILGIAGTALEYPDAYETVNLWVALDEGQPAAAALRTPPHDLVLGDPSSDAALDALLRAVLEDEDAIPGVVGNEPYVPRAAAVLATGSGRVAERILDQGVYALTHVRPVTTPSGEARPSRPEDRELLQAWLEAFLLEAVPEPGVHLEQVDRSIEIRHAAPAGGMWLWWDQREPVSLAGFSGRTPSGIRVGPVYTPPGFRRRGYATGLVAELSAWLLSDGHRACFLYTDLSNPTSNRIYAQIGYERVADAVQYRFR